MIFWGFVWGIDWFVEDIIVIMVVVEYMDVVWCEGIYYVDVYVKCMFKDEVYKYVLVDY